MMRPIVLLLAISCTTVPSVKKLTYTQTIEHEECLLPLKQISLPLSKKIESTVFQATGTTGSILLTSVGVVTDTVIVTTGLAGTIYLCSEGAGGSGCEKVFGSYMGAMENINALWTTKRAYEGTASWRCPHVDHIARAFRKVTSCLHENGEYVAAFEQLSILADDSVMSECLSDMEKKRVEELSKTLTIPI